MEIKGFLRAFFQLVFLGVMVISLVFILQNLRGGDAASVSQNTSVEVYPPPFENEKSSQGDE